MCNEDVSVQDEGFVCGGITWSSVRKEVPLGCILISQPRHLLSPCVSFARNKDQQVTAETTRAPSYPSVATRKETFIEAQYKNTSAYGLLTEKYGLKVSLSRGPVLNPSRGSDGVYKNVFVTADPKTSLWGGGSSSFAPGVNPGSTHKIYVVELERCEKGLARELEDMHVLHRDKHQVASTLFQLQPMEDETNVAENNASDLRRVYATVDGAKTLTRVLKAVQPSEGKDLRGTTVEVSVLRPENGLSQDKISREHVFALSFLLNNTAQNAESVGPVEMVKAATVVIGNLFQDQECVRQREKEGLEVLRKGRIPRDRRTKLTKQLNSLFLSKSSSAGQSLCASVSSSFLQSVFAMATEDPRHDVSTIFVDAALSGKYVLSLSDSETDLDMEKRERRLQFLAQFKASVDSNIAIPVNRETGENTNVTFSELVNAAVETLLQMTGGTPHADGVVQEDVPGTSLTRSEARDYVYMASVLASKPASQSLFLYAHRFHPEAARVAFNTQNVLAKRNRGLGKRKAGDFESFLSLAILLSLASGLQKSCPPDADKPFASGFRKSWSQMAFSIASLFCRALQKIEELPSFPGSTDTTSDEHVGGDLEGQRQELMEIFQDIVTKTQKLDEEFCRSLQSLGAPETGKLFCEQESAAPIRPSFIGNKIEAIDRLWSVIFAEVGTPSFQGQALGSILTSLTLPRQLPGNDGQQVPEVPVEELASVAAGEEKEEEEDNLSCPLEGPLGTVNDQCEPGSQPQPQAAAEKKTVAMDSVDDTIDATVDKGLPREEIRRSAYDFRERNTAVSMPKNFFALASARKKSRRARKKQKVNTAAQHVLSSTPTQDRRKAELLGKAFTEGCGTGGPSETSPAPVQPEEDEELTEQERGSKLAAVNSAFAEKSSRQEARQIMKTTGRLFFRAVMVDGANDNEAEDAGHAIQLACLEDSVVADYFRSRGVGFASLALMVVHCVAVAARTKKDTGGNISGSAHTVSEPSASAGAGAAEQSHSAAMFEGRIRVAFCCDKFRTKFFAKSGDSQGSLRVQLRQDGIYATASSVARRDSDRLEDGTGGVEWQRLLQPEVDYVRRGKVPNIFATTPQYSTICPHISGSLQFLSSYLKAPIGANINIMPSKKVDLIDGRLRVTLTQELAPEPPAWYPAEHVLQSQPCGNITSCDVVSVRTRSGPEGTPLVGVLAACPPIRPQGEAKYELYANILWDKLSQGPRHVEAIDVTTTGSLPVWDLLRVLALSTPLDPEQFARRTEAGQRTGFEQARTQEDALESAMTLLQFSEVQKHTVSQFAALRGSGSEADGKISLQPGECALVTTSVPRIACRSESRGPDVEINVGEPDREMGGLFLDMKRLDDSRVERFLYLSPTFTAFIMEAGNVRDG